MMGPRTAIGNVFNSEMVEIVAEYVGVVFQFPFDTQQFGLCSLLPQHIQFFIREFSRPRSTVYLPNS